MARKKQQPPTGGDGDGMELPPLFDDNPDIHEIAVERIDPPEGFLGCIDPTELSEETIRARYGGGKFRMRARDASSRYVRGVGVAKASIAGEPIFISDSFAKQWRRRQGLAEEPTAARAAPAERAPSIIEMIMLLDKQGEKARLQAREDAQIREKEQQSAHERQLELMRMQMEQQRTQLEADRGRLAADAKEERERNREFMATMIQLVKAEHKGGGGDDAVATLLKGIELARTLGGGSGEDNEADPLAALAANAPAIMAEARRMISSDKPAQVNPAAGDENAVTLEGPIGQKARRLIMHLQRQGKDPETVLSQSMDVLMRTRAAPAAAMSPKIGRARRPKAGPSAAAPRRPTSTASKSPAAKKSATPKG